MLGLVGTAWISSEFFREEWLPTQPREAVVAESGTAEAAGIRVSLIEATDLGSDPSLADSDWAPPAGFHVWRVVLGTESTNADAYGCDVVLIDDRGREFAAGQFVSASVEGYEFSYICGDTEYTLPQTALLVLVPEDANVESLQVRTLELGTNYLEFDIS